MSALPSGDQKLHSIVVDKKVKTESTREIIRRHNQRFRQKLVYLSGLFVIFVVGDLAGASSETVIGLCITWMFAPILLPLIVIVVKGFVIGPIARLLQGSGR